MTATFVSAASAAAGSVSLPSFQTGDVALVLAVRTTDGGGQVTAPAGWTLFDWNSVTAVAWAVGYRVLQAGDSSTGTWTNAERIGVAVYRGVTPGAPFDTGAGASGATTASALTMLVAGTVETDSVWVNLAVTSGAVGIKDVADAAHGWTNRSSGVADDHLGVAEGAPGGGTTQGSYTFPGGSTEFAYYTLGLRSLRTFPQVITQDTKVGTVTSNSSSWTLTYPTNLQSGDLILAFVASDGSYASATWPAGWVAAATGSGANTIYFAKKKSDGTETGTFTLGLSGSEQGSWRIFRIVGWEGTLGSTWGQTGDIGAVAGAASNTGSPSTTPDPPVLNPSTWDVENTLWAAACSIDTSRAITGYPSGMADYRTADVSGGSGGATLGIAMQQSAVASLDPGTFTIGTSDDWATATIAIRPAAGGTTVPGSFAADAIVKRTNQSGSFTANAIVKKTISVATLTANAALVRTISSSLTANAVLKRTQLPTFTADADIKKTGIAASFTANAAFKKTQAASFTADAVLKRSQSTSLTANAVVKKTGTVASLTADAVLKKTGQTASFTTSAITKRTQSSSFTADAWIKRTQTASFTEDAVLKRGQSAALTGDAVVKRTQAASLILDAVLKRSQSNSLAADAVLRRSQSASFTVDAIVRKTQTTSFTADAVLASGVTTVNRSFTADAITRKAQSASLGLDAVLKRAQTPSLTADAILKRNQTASLTLDGLIVDLVWKDTFTRTVANGWGSPVIGGGYDSMSAPGSSVDGSQGLLGTTQSQVIGGRGVHSGLVVFDFVVPASGVGLTVLVGPWSIVVDGSEGWAVWVSASGTYAITSFSPVSGDTWRIKAWVGTDFARTKAWKVGDAEPDWGTNTASPVESSPPYEAYVLRSTSTDGLAFDNIYVWMAQGPAWTMESFTADAVLASGSVTVPGSFIADAITQKTQGTSLTADAVIKRTQSASVAEDAVFRRTQLSSLTADAVLSKTASSSLAADAVALRTVSGSLNADAALKRAISSSATADAVLKRAISGSFSADAIVRLGRFGSVSADAIVLRVQTSSLTEDAVLFKTIAASFTTDAVVMPTFSANAIVRRTQSATFTANAVVMPVFHADAITRKTQTSSFTASAWIQGVGVFGIGLDAVLKSSQSASVTGDAVVVRGATSTFAANAVIRASISTSLTAEAITLLLQSSSVLSQAVIKRAQTGSFSAQAVLLASGTGSVSANAVLIRSQSAIVTADAVLRAARTGSLTADAVVRASFTAFLPASAVLFAPHTDALTADAFFLSPNAAIVSADAVIQAATSAAFSADAVLVYVGHPVWTTPANLGPIPSTPTLAFRMPSAKAAVHFWIELDTVSTFDSGNYQSFKSHTDQTGWEYWDGAAWQPIPHSGVPNSYAGNEARYTIQTPLANGVWYRRVRGGTY